MHVFILLNQQLEPLVMIDQNGIIIVMSEHGGFMIFCDTVRLFTSLNDERLATLFESYLISMIIKYCKLILFEYNDVG